MPDCLKLSGIVYSNLKSNLYNRVRFIARSQTNNGWGMISGSVDGGPLSVDEYPHPIISFKA